MSGTEKSVPKTLSSLKNAVGNDIELIDENGEAELFYIKAEFQLGDNVYAALQ